MRGVAASVTGPSAPHPLRPLAESPFSGSLRTGAPKGRAIKEHHASLLMLVDLPFWEAVLLDAIQHFQNTAFGRARFAHVYTVGEGHSQRIDRLYLHLPPLRGSSFCRAYSEQQGEGELWQAQAFKLAVRHQLATIKRIRERGWCSCPGHRTVHATEGIDRHPAAQPDLPQQMRSQGQEERGVKGWASSPYLGLFSEHFGQDGAADAEAASMPGHRSHAHLKRAPRMRLLQKGAKSGITGSAAQIQPTGPEIPEGGWTVNNCPPFLIYNKTHLSRECAARIVTNGARIVPGIYLLDTRSKGSNAQLYWPFNIEQTCQSAQVSPIAFGITSASGPKDLKSPRQQPLHVSCRAHTESWLVNSSMAKALLLPLQQPMADSVHCRSSSNMTSCTLHCKRSRQLGKTFRSLLLLTKGRSSRASRVLRSSERHSGVVEISNLHRLITSRTDSSTNQRKETPFL